MSEHSTYAWIIDKDTMPHGPPGTNDNAVGKAGPSNAHPECLRLLKASKRNGIKFRLCWDESDDEKVAYEGRIMFAFNHGTAVRNPGTLLPEEAFAPLDDFGEGNSGCCAIEYQDTDGVWKEL